VSDFRIGDEVVWTSQANASHITKHGRIVAVVEPGRSLNATLALLPPTGAWNLSAIKTSLDADTRRHDAPSYLVAVTPPRGKPRLYWPRVNALKLVSR